MPFWYHGRLCDPHGATCVRRMRGVGPRRLPVHSCFPLCGSRYVSPPLLPGPSHVSPSLAPPPDSWRQFARLAFPARQPPCSRACVPWVRSACCSPFGSLPPLVHILPDSPPPFPAPHRAARRVVSDPRDLPAPILWGSPCTLLCVAFFFRSLVYRPSGCSPFIFRSFPGSFLPLSLVFFFGP